MNITLTVGTVLLAATLEDTPPGRELYAQLPLTLTFEDYASTEKIAYLPSKLANDGSTPFGDARAGDITYYAPWGNLAIFYRDYRYSHGLVRLGRISEDIGALRQDHPFTVIIAAAD